MTRLALAPIRAYWPRAAVLAFYAEVAAMPVDVVYVGEAVCARRHELRWADWLEIAAMLAATGKEVVLSSLALIEAEADVRLLRRMAEQGSFRVEANDMGAVNLLEQSAAALPFVAGASLNVWSARTLAVLHRAGATRWVPPPEMSATALATLLREAPPGIETEVLAHGRVPLAHSARCFTARHYGLQKDHCEYRCLAHPDGLPLRTREGQPFLTLNGLETQSAGVHSLLAEVPTFAERGIALARIAPQAAGTRDVVGIFRDVADGTLGIAAARDRLAATLPGPSCNGFWYGRPGAERVEPAAEVH